MRGERAAARSRERDARDRRLVERAQRSGSPAAREAAFAALMPLVGHLARRYAGGGEPLEDLEQVASVGLCKAIAGFDPTRETPFAAYAIPTIVGELRRHFRDRGWMVRPPRGLLELSLRADAEIEDATAGLGRVPTTDELARRLGVSPERLLEARQALLAMHSRSLDREASPEDGDPGETLVDRLGAEDDGFARVDGALTVASYLSTLQRRERELLRLRFEEELTQDEIARRLGVSQMQVSRMLRAVLARLGDLAEPIPELQNTG